VVQAPQQARWIGLRGILEPG